jgi:hypothetical protein
MKELGRLKKLAEELKERGYTVNVMIEGNPVLRIGKEAKPKLLSFFGPIEIKDLKTALKILS